MLLHVSACRHWVRRVDQPPKHHWNFVSIFDKVQIIKISDTAIATFVSGARRHRWESISISSISLTTRSTDRPKAVRIQSPSIPLRACNKRDKTAKGEARPCIYSCCLVFLLKCSQSTAAIYTNMTAKARSMRVSLSHIFYFQRPSHYLYCADVYYELEETELTRREDSEQLINGRTPKW